MKLELKKVTFFTDCHWEDTVGGSEEVEAFLVRGERSKAQETLLRPALSNVILSRGITMEPKAVQRSLIELLYETRSFIQSEVGRIMMLFPCRSG